VLVLASEDQLVPNEREILIKNLSQLVKILTHPRIVISGLADFPFHLSVVHDNIGPENDKILVE
jgi:hypothetical protein